jgi:SprT protein
MKSKIVEVRKEIREAFEAKMVECINRCREKAADGKPLIPIPKLIFRRCGSRAGLHQWSVLEGSTVYINPDFFVKSYDEQLNVTLPHEVAHHVVEILWGHGRGVRSHGWQWSVVMKWIGLKPRRGHNMDMSSVQTRHVERPFKYLCGCHNDSHMLTLRLHEKIQIHGRNRICCRCKQRLVYSRQSSGELRPLSSLPRVSVEVSSPIPKPVIDPMPPATHKTITAFENGFLITKRIPLTPEEMLI